MYIYIYIYTHTHTHTHTHTYIYIYIYIVRNFVRFGRNFNCIVTLREKKNISSFL